MKNILETGLSGSEVEDLTSRGLVNGEHGAKTKSVGRIVRDNICTLFNFINIVLAVFVAITGSFKNMLFMGVITCNVAIGIFQELRAKKTIDRLSLLSAPRARVLRDGLETEIARQEIVPGDICILRRGDEIVSDSLVMQGECEVDESLLTGESDPVHKKEGDELLSGSFLVSGEVKAQVEHVGADNYAIKIVNEAKHISKPNSEMMKAINRIIRIVSICILPIAAILFYKQCFIIGDDINMAIISTVAAIIAMIPEGLVLLTSAVLAVSVVRLSRENTLVQELYCIETLARVDVLCLDKTGTITEGRMRLKEVIPAEGTDRAYIDRLLTSMTAALNDHNPTFDAIKEAYDRSSARTTADCSLQMKPKQDADRQEQAADRQEQAADRQGEFVATEICPFSSEKKCSSVTFLREGTFILGACEFIFDESFAEERRRTSGYAESGLRVLMLAKDGEKREPLAYILIEDVIRKEAPDTLKYFAMQGVDIKVISGDSPVTVAAVAKRAGLVNTDFIDMTTVKDEEELREAAVKYSIFGRVTPRQKLQLVKALKEKGKTVGMTGDGVNDVLALKEADCSIAMQSGSDAARNVSKLVLMDSNFAAMPKVVAEGRRSINNLERSASLFLEKTTYAFLLALIFVFLNEPYPFKPIQLTLVSALTIGVPSFLLALEPNYNLVRGRFFKNVMKRAVPGGVLIVINVLLSIFLSKFFELSDLQVSTVSVIMVAVVSFIVLFRICIPWNLYRGGMYILLVAAFALAFFLFGEFFFFTALSGNMCILIGAMTLFSIVAIIPLSKLCDRLWS